MKKKLYLYKLLYYYDVFSFHKKINSFFTETYFVLRTSCIIILTLSYGYIQFVCDAKSLKVYTFFNLDDMMEGVFQVRFSLKRMNIIWILKC